MPNITQPIKTSHKLITVVLLALTLYLVSSRVTLADDSLSLGVKIANKYSLVSTRQETLGNTVSSYTIISIAKLDTVAIGSLDYAILPYLSIWYGYSVTAKDRLVDSSIVGISYRDIVTLDLGIGVERVIVGSEGLVGDSLMGYVGVGYSPIDFSIDGLGNILE